MQVRITFNTNNAAFEDNGFSNEMKYIFKQALNKILENDNNIYTTYKLYDSNGNYIGYILTQE